MKILKILRAESSLLAGKCHEPLEVALIATYAKEPALETTAFEIRFKFSMDSGTETRICKHITANCPPVASRRRNNQLRAWV